MQGQEFCPVCLKNGVRTKIKAFQLNLQEAVFMCTAQKCTWPVGYQEVQFISRPIGKDWSSTWDESSIKLMKSEQEMLLDSVAYTPPQTPGTEVNWKDVVNCQLGMTTIQDKVESPPTLIDVNVNRSEVFSTSLNTYSDAPTDSSINNSLSSKPKVVVIKSVNCKLGNVPAKKSIFVKHNGNGITLSKTNVQNNVISKSVNELGNSKILIKCDKPNVSPCKDVNTQKEGTRLLGRRKAKAFTYEKFDFNELKKAKTSSSKNASNLEKIKVEKMENESKKCVITVNNENACSNDKIDFSELVQMKSTNLASDGDLVLTNRVNIIDCGSKSRPDLDSILGLTNSKDSGVDQDLADNDLDDLLAGFSDEITASTKSDFGNCDDFKWINSLFE